MPRRPTRQRSARRGSAPVRLIPYPAGGRQAASPPVDGALALAPGPVPAPRTAPPGRGYDRARADPAGTGTGSEAGEPVVDAELRAAALATARLVVEVLSGHRAAHRLAWRVSPEVQEGLTASQPDSVRALRAGRIGRTAPPRVIGLHVQRPVTARAEVTVIARLDGRIHALALCMEPHRGQWRCTAIETTASAAGACPQHVTVTDAASGRPVRRRPVPAQGPTAQRPPVQGRRPQRQAGQERQARG